MLQLIRGRANTGKSAYILDRIQEQGKERQQILLVPDHASYSAEVDLCRRCGAEGNQYAEVLTFRRLTRRVLTETGGFEELSLDNGGKVLMMYRAIQDVSSMLSVYRRPSQKAAFLQEFIDLAEELQRYCVSPEKMMAHSALSEGDAGNKFRDIALIYGAYLGRLSRDGVNLTDEMEKLNSRLVDSGYLQGKDIYLDGFSHFTAQEERAIGLMLSCAHRVTITLLGDAASQLEAFRAGNRAFDRLRELAKAQGSAVEELTLPPSPVNTPFDHLERCFFGRTEAWKGQCPEIEICEADTLYSEVEQTASRIRQLVASGEYRYREIGVAVRNLPDYEAAVESIFHRYQVPVYLSRRSDLLEKPLVTLLVASLEAVTNGFEYEDMFRYLKTGLAGIPDEDCDILENYVLKWDIRGAMWLREKGWTASPDGYGEEMNAEQERRLARVNAIRRQVCQPLGNLAQALHRSGTAAGMMTALYRFLEEIHLPEALQRRTERLRTEGRIQLAEEYRQLWELLCHVMDEFVEILGDSPMSGEEFIRVLKLVISQYSIGTIPAALDQVAFDQIAMNDRHRVRYLFLLGVNDHVLPAVQGEKGILSEEERDLLLDQGLRLAPYGLERMDLELQNIYAALVRPTDHLVLSYPVAASNGTALRPAFLIPRIRRIFPTVEIRHESTEKEYRLTAPMPALEASGQPGGEALRGWFARDQRWQAPLAAMARGASMTRGRLAPDAVSALYGRDFRMSASRIDKVRSCHFAYFMQYGLRAKERVRAGLDPAQIGTFLHYVLEHVLQDAGAAGGVSVLDQEKLRQLTRQHTDAYIRQAIGQVEERDARFRYLLHRLRGTVSTVVDNVCGELIHSDFVPVAFELEFGGSGPLPAITIQEAGYTLSVVGKVDRVDGWLKDGKLYLRVVDYKTGRKSFDLADIRHGLNIQLLLYLFALEREGSKLFGQDVVPAGVLYLPARDVILNMDRTADEQTLRRAFDKELRRSGLLLQDPQVLAAMEHSALEEPRYLPLALDKDHNITRGIASAAQLGKLSRYVDRLLHQVAREVGEGNIDADPCYRSETDNACLYCAFAAACHFSDGEAGDHTSPIYPLKPEEFWQQVDEVLGEEGENG